MKTKLTEYDAMEAYDEMLDECYPPVKIGHGTYYASQILKNCDWTAYRIGFYDYVDSLAEENITVEGWE